MAVFELPVHAPFSVQAFRCTHQFRGLFKMSATAVHALDLSAAMKRVEDRIRSLFSPIPNAVATV